METKLSRRQIIKSGAAVAAVAGTQILLGTPALADFAAGPTLRRNAFSMVASDPILRGYRRAIAAMRALPDENPCSWFYQAAIHGTTDPRNLTAWNTCHTDAQFFWAWHRMYLYWFERIVRKYSGMYDWAIPYWDWANSAERSLPAAFRDSSSLLFDSTRNASVNGGTPLSTSLGTSVATAMTLLDYFNAQSSVNGPHGSVHGAISGNMGFVSSAAQDPIFWVHHAQVDRLWNLWLAQGGGRSSPVGNTSWKSSTYTFFDECCQPVTMKGCDVLRAARQLSYAYEGEPTQFDQYCPRIFRPDVIDLAIVTRLRRFIQLRRIPVRIPLPPPPDPEARRRMIQALQSGEQNLAILIRGIEAETQPGISWEVHVGPPRFTPNPRSLVGIFALFGAGLRDRRHHYRPAEFVFAVENSIRGVDPARLEVVFVPVSGLQESGRVEPRVPVTVGEVALIVDAPAPLPPREEQERLRREEHIR
jgi:tyrosinase